MPERLRIALVDAPDAALPGLIAALPEPPETRSFAGLLAAIDALRDWGPHVVIVPAAGRGDADIGLNALLRRTLHGLDVIWTTPPEREYGLDGLARRAGARLWLQPVTATMVADVVSRWGDPSTTARGAGGTLGDASTLVDVARGIADEINNPLLFARGHLQLLDAAWPGDDPPPDAVARPLAAVGDALDRIGSTVTRLGLLARAARTCIDTASSLVPITPPLRAAVQATRAAGASARLGLGDVADTAQVFVRGGAAAGTEFLRAALDQLAMVGAELAAASGTDTTIALRPAHDGGAWVVRLEFTPDRLDWQLPRTFEPYHLHRLLRGGANGLALFVVQQLTFALGGRTRARRDERSGAVAIDMLLPAPH